MLNNYYTLRLIAQDLNERLALNSSGQAGFRITEIFTQHRDELVVLCESNSTEAHVIISCDPVHNYLYVRDKFPRAKRNSVDLFKDLHGARIREVTVHPSDRQIQFHTDGSSFLAIQLYGPKANALLVRDGLIHDAFLRRKEYAGTTVVERKPFSPPRSGGELHAAFQSSTGELQTALKRRFPSFGAEAVREIMFLAGLEPDAAASQLLPQEVDRLFEASRTIQDMLLRHSTARIYFDGKRAVAFAIIPLTHLARLRFEEFESIHEAVRTFLSASQRQKGFQDERKPLTQFLRQIITKAERSLAMIVEEEESAARAALYETTGKLLMANLHLLSKGMKSVELENVLSPSREVMTIALDPALPPAKNAGRYFDKAKKSRHRSEGVTERKEEVERRSSTAQRILDALEEIDDECPFKEFLLRHEEQLVSVGYRLSRSASTKREELLPFRVFTVSGGFQVWAGKSSENNDLLTMKYAKPDDLWFHARGASGSHVVLKVGTANGNPSKLAIQQAAGIAAYYSKMKNAKLVPVAMTERKYVRKPKGARPGTVMLEREQTIFTEPKLLES